MTTTERMLASVRERRGFWLWTTTRCHRPSVSSRRFGRRLERIEAYLQRRAAR